jgi:hypothetical protein
LYAGDALIYVGVGIAKGGGIYKNCGLGDRLKRYYRVNKDPDRSRQYTPREKWGEVTSIQTIGFPVDSVYLAAALEVFLISRLDLRRNKSLSKGS